MAQDRDFRILGEEPRSLPRKLLRGLLKAIKWAFIIGLFLYLGISALNHEWTDAQGMTALLAVLGWGAVNQLSERLDGINQQLRHIQEDLRRLNSDRY